MYEFRRYALLAFLVGMLLVVGLVSDIRFFADLQQITAMKNQVEDRQSLWQHNYYLHYESDDKQIIWDFQITKHEYNTITDNVIVKFSGRESLNYRLRHLWFRYICQIVLFIIFIHQTILIKRSEEDENTTKGE